MPRESLKDFIGKYLTLRVQPDGATSRLYKLTVGFRYRIKDVDGCCFVFEDNDGHRCRANYQRFEVK